MRRAVFIRRGPGRCHGIIPLKESDRGEKFQHDRAIRSSTVDSIMGRVYWAASTDQGVGLDESPSVRVGQRGDLSGKEFKLHNVGRVVLVSFGRSASPGEFFRVYSRENRGIGQNEED